MTLEIALVLGILAVALVLLVTEVIRMDVVALLVLAALALTRLVAPAEALAGFSNPAVVTVWAMFILSEGLTRSGIADLIGRQMLRLAGQSETQIIAVIMLTAGGLSAFMNNIGVAALMLPVVLDLARRLGHPPSKLLMPLAFGSLLGGLTTLVGTPPNLLTSDALLEQGLRPFRLFDFTPVGLGVMLIGILFVSTVGRRLLPRRDAAAESPGRTPRDLRAQYGLQERTFVLRLRPQSILVGKSLADSGIGRVAGLLVVGLIRNGQTQLLPAANARFEEGQRLLVQGRLDRLNELRRWSDLIIERDSPGLQELVWPQLEMAEARIATGSRLAGRTVTHAEFRADLGVNLLAVRRGAMVQRTRLAGMVLEPGDWLLVQGNRDALDRASKGADFDEARSVRQEDVAETYRLQERIFVVGVPKDSALAGATLAESRLGDAFDFRVLGAIREGALHLMPDPDERLLADDLLLVQGRWEHVEILRGLQQLEVETEAAADLGVLESDRVSLVEAMLSPRSALAGTAVPELQFAERYGLELLAIWRRGRAYRSALDEMTLEFGDALLLLGPREKLRLLERDPDFLVLTPVAPPRPESTKTLPAGLIMAAVVAAVLSGWLPISIAAVAGATVMVVTGCLTMEDAYRAIDWRAIFLIAGMLPLGTAMQGTGAAGLLAENVVAALGRFGPWPVLLGLYLLTALGTTVIPTAALVVLMAPIALTAAANLEISPYTALMAIAIAASASFTSPIAHPANILVMGPGGYRFTDYLKLGIPLALVVLLSVGLLLPIFWPLHLAR